MLKGKNKEVYHELLDAINSSDLSERPRLLKSAFNKASDNFNVDEVNEVSTALLKKYATYICLDSDISINAYAHPKKLEEKELKNIAVTFYYLGKMRKDAGLDNLPEMDKLLEEIPKMKGKDVVALDKMALTIHLTAKEIMDAMDAAPLDEHGRKKQSHNKKKNNKNKKPFFGS